jgi:hypothetical protein
MSEVLFKEDPWQIRKEFPSDKGIQCYIYHDCGAGISATCGGWCSCWDVRHGECYYCKAVIPEHVKTIWLMLEGSNMGSYMQNSNEPWKAPGRPS